MGGLPLTKDLLTSEVVVASKRAERRFQAVWRDYGDWQRNNPSRNPEEYLADLFGSQRIRPVSLFPLAVELVAAVLATPRGYDVKQTNPRYGVRINQPSRCAEHTAFWKSLTGMFEDIAVVTTNYDLLIERSLRHKPMTRGFGPGFYYGGLKRPQVLKGAAQPFTVTNPQRFVELTGSIPVYKLHGSLSWARSVSELELYQDMRPAFRRSGDAAIVPPMSEKNVPGWLNPIWKEAELKLSQADCWIVCGYSLPDYDTAIQQMLRRASGPKLEMILVLDPNSEGLHDRYRQIAPDAEVSCLAGLPEGVRELCDAVVSSLTRPST